MRFIGYLSRLPDLDKAPRQGNRPLELTASFVDLLQQFAPVFTAPTYRTFVAILAGWVLSQRHRFITEVIFSSGNVGNGHWSRFHRFFSHAAWDIDAFSLALTKLVLTILAPGTLLIFTVDDTLCRKHGLTLYGVGMHYDPLISSSSKKLVSWGHDWVVLCVIIVHPFWGPPRSSPYPSPRRLYINRQGLTKGKKSREESSKAKAAPKTKAKAKAAPKTKTKAKAAPKTKTKAKAAPKTKTKAKAAPKTKAKAETNSDHRTRPELALELIHLVARWFADHEILVLGDSAYGGQSILSHLPTNVHLISRVHPKAALYQPAPPRPRGPKDGRARKEIACRA